MFIVKNKKFSLFFGNADTSISLDEIAMRQSTNRLDKIAYDLETSQVIFLKQEHGIQGLHIQDHDNGSQFFNLSGDYLWTQIKGCGIGVITADCLPIVLYDPITHAASVIHAGWKGLMSGIFQVTVQDMIEKIGVAPETLQVYLGPAARPCCYEVQQDFIDNFSTYQDYFHEFFIKKNNKIYFDLRAFILLIARSLGIKHEKIYTRYNVCTICNISFCSYRREKEKARRQITMICLH